jgi:hypothetical protein
MNNGMGINGSIPNTTHHWGGHAMQDPKTKKWVGFFSYFAQYCDLNGWQSQSMIISAVSDAPDGPFDQQRTPVVGVWSHNAMISQHPNGTYYLFHIGDGNPVAGHPPVNCAPGKPDPVFPFHEPPNATLHASESLYGPWRPVYDVISLNNPAVYFWENGSTAMYDRSRVRWAPGFDNFQNSTFKQAKVMGRTTSINPEDPFVWKDKKGRFHMLINANSGHWVCKAGIPCGGHLWSLDGIHWSEPYYPAFGPIIHMEDGTTRVYDYVERAQIAQHPDGTPLTLYVGHGYGHSENSAIMFCQDGDADADCVTMIQ